MRAIASSTLAIAAIGSALPGTAQNLIVPDNTLGNERSRLTEEVEMRGALADLIAGGAIRDANLFHSFLEFNIDEGQRVYFSNPESIVNIFSRVTGSNPSNILGTLGVDGSANLFFLNPNGILFGEAAQLDVAGAFAATTANAIQFGEEGFFSATDPEIPSDLLTVDPSAFFFNQIPAGAIVSRAGITGAGLQVADGETLTLLGGQVTIDGGQISAPGGRVEIGSVNRVGRVALRLDGNLNIPIGLGRNDVAIRNGAQISAVSDEGGDIAITAQNIAVSEDSLIETGINPGQGEQFRQAGDIVLDALDQISISGDSRIGNNVFEGATGNSGNIIVRGVDLQITDGAALSTSTFGIGNAGDVLIDVLDRTLFEGISSDGSISGVFSTVENIGRGNGGTIHIRTGSLKVRGGALLQVGTFGVGNAGNIVIDADHRTLFDGAVPGSGGRSTDSFVGDSAAVTDVNENAVGNGGRITINTDGLVVRNGASLSASTFGEGKAGDIFINARDRVVFNGIFIDNSGVEGGEGELVSAAFTSVAANAIGNGGNIVINTDSLEVSDGAQLIASSRSEGDAGSVIINAQNHVLFRGISPSGEFLSSAFGNLEGATANGSGGNVRITTRVLRLVDRAELQSQTEGQGDAGNIIIRARDHIILRDANIIAIVDKDSQGDGGDIQITTNTLELSDSAQLQASTDGNGDAGNVFIRVHDRFILNNSVVFSDVDSHGNGSGGNITVYAGTLEVIRGGQLNAQTSGLGNAGDILINARDRTILNGSRFILDSSFRTAIFTEVNTNGVGRGGDITINSPIVAVLNGGQLSASSAGLGRAGDIVLNASDRFVMDEGLITTNAEQFAGGNITVQAGDIRLLEDGDIRTDVQRGAEGGGNITLTADSILAFDDSDLIAASADGRGGNITLDTPAFFGDNFDPVDSRNDPVDTLDDNDRVDINATGAVAGIVALPDVSFIQNSLNDLPESLIDTEDLIANSCVVQNEDGSSTFVITGPGGLPERPGDPVSNYPTGDVQVIPDDSVPDESSQQDGAWQPGDPIIEPNGVYQLPTGELVLSHACR